MKIKYININIALPKEITKCLLVQVCDESQGALVPVKDKDLLERMEELHESLAYVSRASRDELDGRPDRLGTLVVTEGDREGGAMAKLCEEVDKQSLNQHGDQMILPDQAGLDAVSVVHDHRLIVRETKEIRPAVENAMHSEGALLGLQRAARVGRRGRRAAERTSAFGLVVDQARDAGRHQLEMVFRARVGETERE